METNFANILEEDETGVFSGGDKIMANLRPFKRAGFVCKQERTQSSRMKR